MARYREKDETDLRWNSIRRRLTRQLDTEIADYREAVLNKLLAGAWDEYSRMLESGEVLALESDYKSWVAQAMTEAVGSKVEALDVAGMDDASED